MIINLIMFGVCYRFAAISDVNLAGIKKSKNIGCSLSLSLSLSLSIYIYIYIYIYIMDEN